MVADVQDLIDSMPEEVAAEIMGVSEADAQDPSSFAAIASVIAKKRDEAVAARLASGIEDIWTYCEEAYLGIDDSNRHEFNNTKWAKPTTTQGPLTNGDKKNADRRSTAFVRLTSRYVDAGAAKICEILLPLDDKAFNLEPTPIPELVSQLNDNSPAVDQATGQPIMQQVNGQPQQMTRSQIAQATLDAAQEAASKAETRIYDWMVEAGHAREMRKVIHDSARIGVGVLKGPFPVSTKSKAARKIDNGVELEIVEQVQPGEKHIDPWNFFPAAGCGEDIHSGEYCVERDSISSVTLRNLKDQPGYNAAAIDQVLKEGPRKPIVTRKPGDEQDKDKSELYDSWYFYGNLKRDELDVLQAVGMEELPEDFEYAHVIVTLVNDTPIKCVIHPLDSGSFPYRVIPWRRRAGHWAGVGVAEQARLPQRMVNAGTRRLLDNAGLSSGAQIIVDRGCIVPADGRWEITPDKIWFKNADAAVQDVREAFMSIEIPNMQPQLSAIIEYAFKLAEESTNVPLISQGQSGKTTPDTFGGQQLQDNNANQLLREIGAAFDDYITEPLVRDYYEWLLLDPAVPDDEKGDFRINAHGSAALVERAIHDQTIAQMAQMVANPQNPFGVDPKKWFKEWALSKRLDPSRLQYTEQELAQMAQQAPPVDPKVQAAQVMAQADIQIEQMKIQAETGQAQAAIQSGQQAVQQDTPQVSAAQIRQQTDLQVAQMNQQSNQNELTFKARENELQRAHELQMKQIELEIAMTKLATDKNISLEQIKAELASNSMKLTVQKQLSDAALQVDAQKHAAEVAADLHKHYNPQKAPNVLTPPTEPVGRAAPGQAFEQ